jgi:hypothetical protein
LAARAMRCSVSRHRRRLQGYYSWRVSPGHRGETDNPTFVLNFDERSDRARGASRGGGAPWPSRIAGARRRKRARLDGDRPRFRCAARVPNAAYLEVARAESLLIMSNCYREQCSWPKHE